MVLPGLHFKDIVQVTESSIRVKVPSAVFWCGVTMWLMLASNILWSCSQTFDCRTFWPTVSYVACYRGHDRLYAFAVTFYSLVVLLTLPMFLVRVHSSIDLSHKVMLWLGGVLIFLAVPWLGLLDEANSSHVLPIEKIHFAIIVGVQTVGLLWVYLSAKALHKAQVDTSFLKKYIGAGVCLLICCIYQWRYVNDPEVVWATENLEALAEWGAVTMSVFLPYVYTKTLGDCWVEIKG
jgi:hypothetical protein